MNGDQETKQSTGDPHIQGFFMRLLRRFGRVTHPLAIEQDDPLYGKDAEALGSWWNNQFSLPEDRRRRHAIYREMDTFPLCEGYLDTLAEEPTQMDFDKKLTVWIEGPDHMNAAGMECLRNVQIEDQATRITRRMCKYGDTFQRLVYATGNGVLGWREGDVDKVFRVDDKIGRLIGFREDGKKFRMGRRDISWPWDYVHFRLLGRREKKDKEAGEYGTSALDAVFRPWRALCLVAGTKIWTTRGPMDVEKLEVGDTVYCHDPHTQETRETDVVKVISMGEQDLVRVWTRHRSILVTPNHGLLVRDRNGEFSYKRASDLVVRPVSNPNAADQLVLPSVRYGESEQTVRLSPDAYYVMLDRPFDGDRGRVMERIRCCHLATSDKNTHAFLQGLRPIRHSDYCKIRRQFDLPAASVFYRKSRKPCPFGADLKFTYGSDFVRLFGFLLGDGWVKRNIVGFALGVDEEQNQRYIEIFQRVFGIKNYLRCDAADGAQGGSVIFHSAAVVDIFQTAGFVTGFAKKIIPERMYALSPELKRELIQGLLDADGGYQDTGDSRGWRLSLSNRKLIDGVVMLAQQAGYDVSSDVVAMNPKGKVEGGWLRKDGEKRRKIVTRNVSYRIWIKEGTHDALAVYENVLGVEPIGVRSTWDLTVEDDLHNFVAEGIASHNTLTEDAMLMYRVQRAPDRNIFYIDVGNMEEHEAMEYTEEFRKRFRKHEFIDPASPQYKKQFNPLLPTEDIFLPTRGDRRTTVEPLTGSANVGELYDLEHFVRSFFAGARMPKAYAGWEGEINAKATLMQQDVRWARTCKRVQRSLIYGVRQTLDIHFVLLGDTDQLVQKYNPDAKANEYVVQMSPIAYLDEWERLELVQLRYQVVEAMSRLAADMGLDAKQWASYVLTTYARIPPDLVKKLLVSASQAPEAGGREFEWVQHANSVTGDVTWRPEARKDITESIDPDAGHNLSAKEERLIAEAVHSSPMLRKVIGDIAEYAHEADATAQYDPSLVPPTAGGRQIDRPLEEDERHAIQLRDDLAAYRKKYKRDRQEQRKQKRKKG